MHTYNLKLVSFMSLCFSNYVLQVFIFLFGLSLMFSSRTTQNETTTIFLVEKIALLWVLCFCFFMVFLHIGYNLILHINHIILVHVEMFITVAILIIMFFGFHFCFLGVVFFLDWGYGLCLFPTPMSPHFIGSMIPPLFFLMVGKMSFLRRTISKIFF